LPARDLTKRSSLLLLDECNEVGTMLLRGVENLVIARLVASDAIKDQERRLGGNVAENIWKVRFKTMPLRSVETDADLFIHKT
jgi:hypothetical protein